MLQLEIYGDPVPLQRPRFFQKGGSVHVFDAQKKEKELVRWQAKGQYKEMPLTEPLIVDLEFGLPIPTKTSKIKTRCMLQGDITPNKKPDLDNLVKFILDCLNGILFHDDSQIVEIKARKKYSSKPVTLIRAMPRRELMETKSEGTNRNDAR